MRETLISIGEQKLHRLIGSELFLLSNKLTVDKVAAVLVLPITKLGKSSGLLVSI